MADRFATLSELNQRYIAAGSDLRAASGTERAAGAAAQLAKAREEFLACWGRLGPSAVVEQLEALRLATVSP